MEKVELYLVRGGENKKYVFKIITQRLSNHRLTDMWWQNCQQRDEIAYIVYMVKRLFVNESESEIVCVIRLLSVLNLKQTDCLVFWT